MRRVFSTLLVLPSLLSVVVAIPSYNASERDDNGTDADSNDTDTLSGKSLEEYCSAQLGSFEKTYQSTQIATSLWTWYEGFGLTDSVGDLTGPVTSQSYFTSTFLYTQYAIRAYTPKPPCCSSCYMTAGTIDFYFWPDQATPTAPTPGQPSTSVHPDGFTFTSPSVYMAFSSLGASNRCGQVGEAWTSTTIGFDASEITTAQPITTLSIVQTTWVSDGSTYNSIVSETTTQPSPRAIDFKDIGQDCSTIPGYVYWPDNPMNAGNAEYHFDPCHPVILLPPRLISMQPAWAASKCGPSPGMSGAYDPPRVLTPMVTGTTLPTPTVAWGNRVDGSNDASPASSAQAVAPSTTTRPAITSATAIYDQLGSSSTPATATAASNNIVTGSGGSATNIQTAGMGAAIISGLGGAASDASSAGSGTSIPGSARVISSAAASSASVAQSKQSQASQSSNANHDSQKASGAAKSTSASVTRATNTPVSVSRMPPLSTSSGIAASSAFVNDVAFWLPIASFLLRFI